MQAWLIPFRHNHWATRELLDACRPLSQERLHQRFEIGRANLHDTVAHIIGAMTRWAERISDQPVRRPHVVGRHSIDKLVARLDDASGELERVARKIHETDRLFEVMRVVLAENEYRFTRAAALCHVTTHGMHHRAQVLNMLRQCSVSPLPEIDVIDWELATAAR